jgi:ribonucleoside-diphosphate reductase alpha chain
MSETLTPVPTAPLALPLQPTSADIWDSKYRLKTREGEAVDQTLDDTFQRVAKALAAAEAPAQRAHWQSRFLWALRQGAIPAGRITSNAGAKAHKPKTSTINCTVSMTVADDMVGIFDAVREAAITLKSGAGIGYCFSTLRPKGAIVAGAGASTSGPLPFMEVFDKTCATVSSAGGRRGAQMGTFDVQHPDVEDFIRAKRQDGMLRHFNLSLLITEDFLAAVRADAQWPLVFPLLPSEPFPEDPASLVWRDWEMTEGYRTDDQGRVACRVYKTLKARDLWDLIMRSTYDYAEPGFILIDRVNAMNNNWFCEDIRATNP